MKRVVLMLLPFLVACQSVLRAPRSTSIESAPDAIAAFQFGPECPHLCWMGINPGVTTASSAHTILARSNGIDHRSTQVSTSDVSAVWNTRVEPSLDFPVYVGLAVQKGLVETISFGDLPFRIQDLTAHIGEPDKISITFMRTAESQYLLYDLYFSSRKIMLEVYLGSLTGPDPRDYIGDLYLNKEFTIASWQGPIQPWLGYGHVEEYLPGGLHMPGELTPTVSP